MTFYTPTSEEFLAHAKASGLTWRDIANRLGISIASVWALRHGDKPLPLKARIAYRHFVNDLHRNGLWPEPCPEDPPFVPAPYIPDKETLADLINRTADGIAAFQAAYGDDALGVSLLDIWPDAGEQLEAFAMAAKLEAEAIKRQAREEYAMPGDVKAVIDASRSVVRAAKLCDHDEDMLEPLKALSDALKAL